MKGTSNEVLEWLTYHREYAPLMQMSRQRLVGLRHRLSQGTVSENMKEEILERLQNRISALKTSDVGCNLCMLRPIKKVRNQYILPAVVRDNHGRFFSELALIKMAACDERYKDLNLGSVYGAMKRGRFPSKEVVREVLRRKKWYVFEDRMVLPSVWEVED